MKKKIVRLSTVFIFFAVFGFQAAYSQIEKFQAAYIYNITRYVEWPADYKQGNFVIGILGNNAKILPELNKIAASKKVVNRTIEVQEYANASSIGKCNILFIPSNQGKNVAAAASTLGKKGTLIFSNSNGALDSGSAINFIMNNNKLQFELKKANISSRRLTMSSSLEQLAAKTY